MKTKLFICLGALLGVAAAVQQAKHRFGSLAVPGRFTLTELGADSHASRKTGHRLP